jgi:hypothetical protein
MIHRFPRPGTTSPVTFLHVTGHAIELWDLAQFQDHWSRESSYSRSRTLERGSLRILTHGSVTPELFSVSGGPSGGFQYRKGRRFAVCTGTVVTVPENPYVEEQRIKFAYFEADTLPNEPLVKDVETVRFPNFPKV